MPKFKYNAGDSIGPYNILMTERLEKVDNKHWICSFKCPYCGKIFTTKLDNVVQGDTKSCGCYAVKSSKENGKKKAANLIGQKFGKLTVLRKTDQRRNTYVVWECQCDCGNISYVTTRNLTGGNTKSCGHCVTSKGELKIQEILDKLNIKYFQEYSFNECINPKTNYKLRFDFYLPEYNCCIEYDGIQHFKYYETGWVTKQKYEDTIYRDTIKNLYCKNNKIKLIRIPYTEYKNINQKYLKELIFNDNII